MSSSGFCFEILLGSRSISAKFDGGRLSGDGGLVLLREVDKKPGLIRRLADCIRDGRDRSRVKVTIAEMLSQRIMGIVAGYEDCNDHGTLKSDPMLRLASGERR